MESDLVSSPINPSLPHSNSTAHLCASHLPPDQLVVLNLPISTKLTSINFLAWKFQIEPALHGHGLYKYLTDDPPSKNLTTEGCQQDQLLLTWIRSSLSETILNQTVSFTTSAQLWQLLQQSFFASSRARLTELCRSLQTTTKGSSSCLEFCQRMRAIADELAFIGSPVSDDDLIIQILTGLGSDYNAVVVAANAKEHLNFPELQFDHKTALLQSFSFSFSSAVTGEQQK